jgi:D-threo-aldose 1-dehydrogenase
MKKIRLTGTDITTSPLGFGCGQLMRVSSVKSRQRLLNEAHDLGICHFDVARMYGFGAAERELGKFARGRRDGLVIATKFGIDLSPLGSRAAHLQGVARRLSALFPALRKIARRNTGTLVQPRQYDAAKACASLETSLRELGTDYVDIFLLHEPTLQDVTNSDVLEYLEKAKRQGKIKAYGISGPVDDMVDICRKLPELTPVVQIPNDVIGRSIETLAPVTDRAVVTYSPFSNALERIIDHVKTDPGASCRWRESVGVDCSSSDNVSVMLLHYCLSALPKGVVLFSTTRPERLRLLVQSVSDGPRTSFSMESFIRQVDKEIRIPGNLELETTSTR